VARDLGLRDVEPERRGGEILLCRKHRIFWWRMVSILYITLSNAHNRTLVSVIV